MNIWVLHPQHDYCVLGVFESEELALQAKELFEKQAKETYIRGCARMGIDPGKILDYYYVQSFPVLTTLDNIEDL
ncbi:MAG: hypothetical protein E6R03_13420 [Hyphomicrobiaceae bacterium]|nr:MAG: hypothetical protein E6R03_13420 [Hyphomicrobiaceae bacterium]